MKNRTAAFSLVNSKYIVMPHHSNPTGLLFGGVLMSWIDMAAAMVAEKHSGKDVATVHVDPINFGAPVLVGEHVIIRAELIETGNTSMKITVYVESENVKTYTQKNVTQVTLTFVAVDEMKKPVPVPQLLKL